MSSQVKKQCEMECLFSSLGYYNSDLKCVCVEGAYWISRFSTLVFIIQNKICLFVIF